MIKFLDTKELNVLDLNHVYQCDHDIRFRCFLSKSIEYIQFIIELMSYPSHYSGIHIYYQLYCHQTHSEYKGVKFMRHLRN